jgi:DNA polymerase III gamma/tau subunit
MQEVELYRTYRPKKLTGIIGQDGVVTMLQGWLNKNKLPHAMLFVGASGTGKTSTARIIAKELGCKPPRDLIEINAADATGVDMIRTIRETINYRPLSGKGNRCWIIDEAALLSTQAQSAALKILEETPDHAYIILCTTDPQKLLPTIKNRCSLLTFKPVSEPDLLALCQAILEREGIEVSDEVLTALVANSNGSPRLCLVKLGQLIELPDDDLRLRTIVQDKTFEASVVDLCKALTTKSKQSWKEVAKIVQEVLENNDPETIRYAILGWCAKSLLNGWGNYNITSNCIDIFQFDTYSSKRAGLINMCYKAWQIK